MGTAVARSTAGAEDGATEAPPRHARRARPDVAPLVVLAFAFVASRLGYSAMGVRWDGALLDHAWQLLDLELLEHDLWTSVWYLHIQPPLFNVFVGLVLQLSPFDDQATFAWVFALLGVLLLWLVYDILRSLDFGRWWAVGIAVVICCGPTVMLYESWFAYEYPLFVLVTGSVAAFLRWQRSGRLLTLATTTLLAAAAVLTRSLFHPAWLVFFVVVAVLARPRRADAGRTPSWAGTLLVALVPLLLVGGLMAKQQVLFGTTDLSSWLGWNLTRIATGDVTPAEQLELVESGDMPGRSLLYINQPYAAYEADYGPCESSQPDIAALSETTKSVAADQWTWIEPGDPPPVGDNNLNHECYLRVYEGYEHDARQLIGIRGDDYRDAVASAFTVWALPSADYVFLRGQRDAMQPIETWWNHLVLADVAMDPPVDTLYMDTLLQCVDVDGTRVCFLPDDGQYRISLTVVLGTLASGLLALWAVGHWIRRRDPSMAVWIVVGATIWWTTLAGNLVELGENMRFRAIVEPLVLIVVVWLLRGVVRGVGSRIRPRRDPPASDALSADTVAATPTQERT